MSASPSGLHPSRLVKLMRAAIDRCRLDLRGLNVLTEAATGAYAVTPVLAAMAGADAVWALARPSRHGSLEEAMAQTRQLAAMAGVNGGLRLITEKSRKIVAQADIITNSGHVRPIDAETVSWMKPGAVVPLMYEAWELRDTDLDLAACRQRGIRVAGTNEQHPAVGVFSYLGLMALKLLMDAGVAVFDSRILLLCDNPFGPFLETTLAAVGAAVERAEELQAIPADRDFEVVLVALKPGQEANLGRREADFLARHWPGALVAQFWGEVDREALAAAGQPVWPEQPPAPGHMGVLPSALGPEPVIRLQAGGLKAGEILAKPGAAPNGTWDALAQVVC